MAAQSHAAVTIDTDGYEANVYGFVRAVASYDFDEKIASGGQAGDFSKITTGSGNTSDGHFGIDANTSRLGVQVMTPQGVKMVVEFDFDGSDGIDPRLRHAYGSYNGVLIGRNWSNFNSFVGNPATLDFDGIPGSAGTQSRIEQVRYTTGALSLSIEQPFSAGVGRDVAPVFAFSPTTGVIALAPAGTVSTAGTKETTPAFTARYEDSQGGLTYSAAVMAKQTAYDTGSADDNDIGYAAFVAGKVMLTDMLSVNGTFGYADGATSYVYRAGGNFGQYDGYTDANGDIETVEAYGGAIGASLGLGNGSSVNLGYGMATVDLDDAVLNTNLPATATDTNSTMFINYQWVPIKDVKMGVEFANLKTETQGGNDGDANRVMFLAQYSF
jgi:hypothetical protein